MKTLGSLFPLWGCSFGSARPISKVFGFDSFSLVGLGRSGLALVTSYFCFSWIFFLVGFSWFFLQSRPSLWSTLELFFWRAWFIIFCNSDTDTRIFPCLVGRTFEQLRWIECTWIWVTFLICLLGTEGLSLLFVSESALYGGSGASAFFEAICLIGNNGYALSYMISVTGYARVRILTMLGYVCYMREILAHNLGSLSDGKLELNGGCTSTMVSIMTTWKTWS